MNSQRLIILTNIKGCAIFFLVYLKAM